MKLNSLCIAAMTGCALLAASCSELQNDIPAASPSTGVHPEGWSGVNPSAPTTHGKFLKGNDWDDTQCKPCHGGTYTGGSSGVSCFGCHDAYPHSARFSARGHTGYLKAALYPLAGCKTCHGSTYQGGSVVEAGCSASGCHVDRTGAAKSPEACNTCHGDFRAPASDALSAAPPRSVDGDTVSTAAGVGAHRRHLVTAAQGKKVKCQECHVVPTQWDAPGHIDADFRAEVAFNDTLARLPSGDGTLVPAPAYDRVSLTCANTYCHGNWKLRKGSSSYQFVYTDSLIVGGKFSPKWTSGSGEASCGTCHAIAPAGHTPFAATACAGCHTGVIDGTGTITDPAAHVNGKINLFGSESPFR